MKKNQNILIVATITSLVLAGCGERRDCVDALGNKRPDSECRGTRVGATYPRFIYGGRISNGRVSGGSVAPKTSTSYGGFGGRGSSIS